jgi:hypothetical protein
MTMAKPHNEGDVRDLREWAKAFPNANGAYETAVWVATYDMLHAVLVDCGTDTSNPDTCGCCHRHFAECDAHERAVGNVVNEHDIPIGREPACPGGRARAVLRG